jgi:hypothetical protein
VRSQLSERQLGVVQYLSVIWFELWLLLFLLRQLLQGCLFVR